ncbi:MAG: OmpA family protein [Myxococcota bacterium]|nr:OmpA family protein [Myxococcota bacterium]
MRIHSDDQLTRNKGVALCVATAFLFLSAACTTDPYTGEQKISKTAIGAVLGAGVGAAIGAATGKNKRERKKRALIGAGAGALAGGGVGAYMDAQEAKLRRRLEASGVGVQRVGNDIILVMPGNITFATDDASLRPDFYEVLNSVGIVLVEYDKTVVEVAGHTDSTGSDEYNRALSGRRAQSVASYLRGQGVSDMRLLTLAYGEGRPVAPNDTEEGRQENRRVEITLAPVVEE